MATSELRFAAYVEGLVEVIGHADRAVPLQDYCLALLMPGDRKSVEPMAAVTAPARVPAQHQSLLHFVGYATKLEIALDQIRAACAAGIPRGTVLMDAGYGSDTKLRTELTALGLAYVAGIQPHTTVWLRGQGPLPAKAWSGRGRPTSRTRRDPEHQPVQVKALGLQLPKAAWQMITWREGSADWLTSRYARLRVRAAHRDERLKERRAEEWLLIEWPEDEKKPTKYLVATLPENIPFNAIVELPQLDWRIARDYHERQQELGLGHYEGRGWRGFHHHATLCIAAYGFLISERETIPPSGPCVTQKLPPLAVPDGYRSRGAADPARTTHLKLDRHHATTSHRRPRQEPPSPPMLQRAPQNRSQ